MKNRFKTEAIIMILTPIVLIAIGVLAAIIVPMFLN
jgi:hypothetical protein